MLCLQLHNRCPGPHAEGMDWWEWVLLAWLGGTVGFAALLGIVVAFQRGRSWLTNRDGADSPPTAIDLRDSTEKKSDSRCHTEVCAG